MTILMTMNLGLAWGEVAEIVPDKPGTEWEIPGRRSHWKTSGKKSHWEIPGRKPHWKLKGQK